MLLFFRIYTNERSLSKSSTQDSILTFRVLNEENDCVVPKWTSIRSSLVSVHKDFITNACWIFVPLLKTGRAEASSCRVYRYSTSPIFIAFSLARNVRGFLEGGSEKMDDGMFCFNVFSACGTLQRKIRKSSGKDFERSPCTSFMGTLCVTAQSEALRFAKRPFVLMERSYSPKTFASPPKASRCTGPRFSNKR
ncbi:hypothetical protein TNIN_287441 [Trichonephila inaurata madagascariensis]|uniref:Uncharacterized protein n=1 Tax=Trichonephila inaurata madagascariensis TaxID=2747483 RepID=A0A8X6XDR8_9ARAC|nr:hypothetical protein TNIN_287441 [Trichonephila inaurata madagascariensis]